MRIITTHTLNFEGKGYAEIVEDLLINFIFFRTLKRIDYNKGIVGVINAEIPRHSFDIIFIIPHVYELDDFCALFDNLRKLR